MGSIAPGKISLPEKNPTEVNWAQQFLNCASPAAGLRSSLLDCRQTELSRQLLALKMEEVSAFKVLRFCSKGSDLPWFDVWFVCLMRAGSCQFVYVLA